MDSRRHTVLIVDDEPDLLESLDRLLRRRYEIVTATSGEAALEVLGRQPIHVILSDQRMPGLPGDVFLDRARQRVPEAVRVLFTGYADIESVVNAVNRGQIFKFVLKPWDPIDLEAVVEQAAAQFDLVADRARLLRELQQANDELMRANRELAEMNQLKTAFLEVASHEFNTPITLVHGMSELLRLMNPDREETEREIVEKLSEGARRLARLVSDTLKLMTAEDFRLAVRRASVDLAALLDEVAEEVQPFVKARHQEFRRQIAPDLGTFEIDAFKIRDAVVNLLTNAIKFTPDGGRIELRADRIGPDEARLQVVDTGVGVDARTLDHFFEPFFTEFEIGGHSSGYFEFQKRGLGLGLSLVKKFVELHDGRVEAVSTVGEGTSVTIVLPRQARKSEPDRDGLGRRP